MPVIADRWVQPFALHEPTRKCAVYFRTARAASPDDSNITDSPLVRGLN